MEKMTDDEKREVFHDFLVNPQFPIYVRAWVPTWGAQKWGDSVAPQPAIDYSMWYIGHTIIEELSDEVLDRHVAAAVADGIEDTDDFHDYLGSHGYLTFTSAADDLYIADLPDNQE